MNLKRYCCNSRKAVMTTFIVLLMLAASALTAYGADEIAVGAKNSAYYYDQQKMNIDQQGRLIDQFSESFILANNYASKFSPSTQDFDYNVGTIISNPGEITIYVSKTAARDNNVMITVSGHGIISPNVDNKQAEYEQFQALAKAGESRQLPYHIWNLGKLTDNNSGWKLSFNNEKGEYYEKTIRVDNITQDCQLWGFIDYDYDYYYSNNDIASSDVNSTRYLIRPIKLMKDYDGPYELHELPITAASFPPYLTINGDTLTPIANDTTDVLIDLYSSTSQTWYLLGEYAGFKDRNRLGYYTDIDTGRNVNLVFSGPRQAPYVATTSITRPIIGLWFHNDVNANLVYDGDDSWLLSQRYLTSGSAANEHQWFKVYDVRAYKGLGVSYVFHTASEGNWTGTGNYDYLVFCDDDHTSADWDHNDMIFGLLCNRPPVAVCHNDTTVTQCSFSQIAIHGFSASDPDYNLSTVYAVGGTFAGDSIRFTPTAEGTYSLKLIATDTYGLADTCETKVTVVLNSAPDAQSPADTTIHQGGLTLIKLPGFRATDPNNNITSLTVNTGTLHGDTLWFTPVAGLNVLKIIATDACGLKDSSITNVTVIVNRAPVLDPIGPKTVYEGAHLQFVVTSSDPDGDLLDLSAAPLPTHAIFADSGNGHGLFTFDPDYTQAGIYYVLFIVKERTGLKLSPTGLADSELVQITVLETNRPPVVVCHGDTTMFRCNTNAVALHGYSASDPDGNLANVYAIGGTFAGDSVMVTPSGPGVNSITIKLVAVDSLGSADTCETHLTITVNRPPVAISPPDTSLFRCDASEICIPGFTASDPDGNLASVDVLECYIKADSVCFTASSGTHVFTYIATDSCGLADTSITRVTITLNQDPMVNTPADTTIFQCNLTQIKLPGFWIMDPDNNVTTVTVSTGTLHGDTLWFMPIAGLNTIKVVATDSCGLKDSSITNVTVNLNTAPDAQSPNDTTIFQCSLTQIQLPGFRALDADNNITSVVVTPGTLHGDTLWFTPVAGLNTLKIVVTDACGLKDSSITRVTVNLNTAPDAQSPNDTTIFQCSLTQIQLPGFRALDAENNITSVVVTPGTLHGDTLWFTPVAGLNTLKIVVTDACGLKDSSITRVTVNLNTAPDAQSPNDTTIFQCSLTQIQLPGFRALDADNNITSVVVTPGTLHGDTLWFTPVAGLNTLKIVVTDACGLKDSSITRVTVNLNTAPDAQSPNDTTIFQCSLTQIQLPGFRALDAENNITSIVVTPGTLHGDTLWFTPVAGLNTLKIVVTDACGLKDSSITRVTVNLNTAPDAQSPNDTTIFQCSLTQIQLPGFRALDADNNITSVVVTPGTLHGDTLWFTPVAGLNTLKIVVTDACGLKDSSITRVTVNLNTAPDAQSPNDTTIFQCSLTQIQLLGFRALDAENNITSVVVTPGTLHADTLWFTPVAGLNTLKIVVTDACGLKDSSITRVTVNLNTAPDAQSPNDTTIFQCSLTQIQLPGFRALDADNNITSVVVTPGTLHGDTLWFTPVAGLNTLKIVVTDACGLKDSSITRVTVNLNTAPDAQSPNDTTIFQCSLTQIQLPGFRALDADNNITSVVVTPGTLHGDTLWFTPVAGLNTCKIVVTDACGLKDSSITRVTVNLNTAPDAQSPNDTTIFQCSLTQIQLPGFRALDAENNITSVVVTPGILHGDTLWFTPVAGLNTLKIVVTDACGLKDSSITNVTVTVNSAPDAQAHGDTTIFQCSITEIRLPGFRAIDVNNNIVSVTVSSGTLHGDTLWFTPVAGLNTLKIVATDSCGAIDSAICQVTVNINTAPDAQSPADTSFFLCNLTQIQLPGFRALDADNNITSVVVTPGTLHGDTLWFTPTAGLNTLKIVVTDACGLKDSSITIVTVNPNTVPVANCPNDTTVTYTCVPSQICIGPYSATDNDGNLDTTFVLANSYGGTFNGATYCFTPSGIGTYTIRYVARDECGAADTCATVVTVQMINRPPVANCHGDTTMTVCSLTQICLGGFTASDPDNNLSSITVTGGTLQSGGVVCFTPVAGVNTITLYAADSCGAMDTCRTLVTVIVNSPPSAICAHDSVITVDTLAQICIPGFTATDIDGNLVSAGVIGAVMHGDTACFVPVLGMNTLTFIARDACGLADTCITRINVALSHIGSCPIITRPFDDSMNICTYGDYCDTIDVIDPDGDPITVTTTIGTLTPIINVPGHWRGLLCFDVPDSACGNSYTYGGILRASDDSCGGCDSIIITYTVLGKITVSMPDSVGLWPGVADSFPVYIDAVGDCFCLGGFVLTVTYDNSIFDILGVTRASLISSAEYFFVNYNPSNPDCPENGSRAGAFKVVMINDLNNQIPAPTICDIPPHTPLFWVHVMARADYTYPTNFCVPICFQLCEPLNYQWNSISDISGNYVWKTEGCLDGLDNTWYLEMICGNLKILSNSNVIRGDVNLNNQPFEIGDAVTLANYLIDPTAYPMNIRQLVASDVNGDSIRGSIADLIYMINVINGTIRPKQTPSVNTMADFLIRQDSNGRSILSINASIPIGGFVFELPTNDAIIGNIEINSESGMDIRVTKHPDYLRVCAYSLEGRFIPEGEIELLSFDSDREIKPASAISVSDNAGNLINGAMKIQLPLPTELNISATYPNPFNSTIMIECALPADDNISLKIYDIAGRLVSNFDLGYQTAGYHKIAWNGMNSSGNQVSTGIYFAKLESNITHLSGETKRLTLIK